MSACPSDCTSFLVQITTSLLENASKTVVKNFYSKVCWMPCVSINTWKQYHIKAKAISVQFSSIQSLSRLQLFATPWISACQASLSITNSQSSLRLASIESMMPSSHLILCHPLLFLPPIPPSIKVFSNESTLLMRWPKYWSFSFSIIPSKEIPRLKAIYIYSISFLLTKNWFTKQIWLD